MDERICRIVKTWTRFRYERGFPESCRTGNDPSVADALENLGIDRESALAYLYQHLIGPFSSSGDNGFGELLDITSGDRNVVTFSERYWEQNPEARHSILAISEIYTMTGLFYDIDTDAVFAVEFEYDWLDFVSGELPPRWMNSVDFLVDFFAEGTNSNERYE